MREGSKKKKTEIYVRRTDSSIKTIKQKTGLRPQKKKVGKKDENKEKTHEKDGKERHVYVRENKTADSSGARPMTPGPKILQYHNV